MGPIACSETLLTYQYKLQKVLLGSIFYQCIYMALFVFNNVIYVSLLLWLCILIVCLCMITLTEGFPCFFLSCKVNVRVKPAKTGQVLCCSVYFLCCSMYFCVVLCTDCFVTLSVLFVCICVLNYCHRVATQLQLNISYHFFVGLPTLF